MAADADLVDCVRLAADAAALHRDFELKDLPRLQDLLADSAGTVDANFAFATLASGRPGATVGVNSAVQLVCQRCMQAHGFAVTGESEIEFAAGEVSDDAEPDREFFRMDNGRVSLRELAEEELLLALPMAPMCSTPATCGKAPSYAAGEGPNGGGEMRRPFSVLQELLKKP